MPAFYTHYAIAREALKHLAPPTITLIKPHLPFYFFGAQGADFCFFYRTLSSKKPNLGSYLHRQGGYDALCSLNAFSRYDNAIAAYALGYVTHYAADCLFHPYVYARAQKSYLTHSLLENEFDKYFLRQDRALIDEYLSFYRAKPSASQKEYLFLIYNTILKKSEFAPLQKTAFQRALTLFFGYKPLSDKTIRLRPSPRTDPLNLRRLAWRYPADQTLIRTLSIPELYQEAISLSLSLQTLFLQALQNKNGLSTSLFGKNYLTGI